MSKNREYYERSKAALEAGELKIDTPPREGGDRYGISAVLRPSGPIVADLEALRREAEPLAGPGQWLLDAGSLHATLRALEPHSTRSFTGDARFAAYVAALDEAVSGFPPVELELRGVAPHPGGVMVLGHCGPEVLPALRRRYVDALDTREVEHHEAGFVRDLWYLSLIQFAAPVRDVPGLIAWGEANRDRLVGTAVFREVEIMRWHLRGDRLVSETLHIAKLDG